MDAHAPTAAPGAPTRRKPSALEGILRSPTRLRLVVTLTMLGGWYFGLYGPTVARIDELNARLADERKRIGLAREVGGLRGELDRIKGRLLDGNDRDALARHLMGLVHGLPLRLTALSPRPPVEAGPYRAAVFQLSVEGSYEAADGLLRRLEGSPRLLRLDSYKLTALDKKAASTGSPGAKAAASTGQEVELQVVVVGIIGVG